MQRIFLFNADVYSGGDKNMSTNVLAEFYRRMDKGATKADSIFVFVYNDDSTYKDDPHIEECYGISEKNEMIDSVSDLFEKIFCFGSELQFIDNCKMLQEDGRRVYVYSMAQIIEGYSRRALIPALCLFYGFINLNADSYMSTMGCNKEIMFRLLNQQSMGQHLAPTLYFDEFAKIDECQVRLVCGDSVVVKPISESCCIDVIILNQYTKEDIESAVTSLVDKYSRCMVQRYIHGEEIGITVFYHNGVYHALQPIRIEFPSGKHYLTHIDSYYDNYELVPCNVPIELMRTCESMSKVLEFKCISRYDLRFDGNHYYLFDISPNPTLSDFSSCNYAARHSLQCDHRGVYRLLAFEKLHLFEPSLYRTIQK